MAGIGIGIVHRGRLNRIIVGFAVVLLSTAGVAAAEEAQNAKPIVSDKPLAAEQLAIYRAVLHGWMDNELSTINLAAQTSPFPTSGAFDASSCGKELELEPVTPDVIHRFRAQDLSQLGSDKIVFVDPDRQRREVHENDPGKTISEGRSVEDAVRNGFAHGLVTLSEIRFDKGHNHAIVSYGFFCGSLCGNGGTAVLEKVEGVWQRKSRCGEWIS